jgi:hypothetical protein
MKLYSLEKIPSLVKAKDALKFQRDPRKVRKAGKFYVISKDEFDFEYLSVFSSAFILWKKINDYFEPFLAVSKNKVISATQTRINTVKLYFDPKSFEEVENELFGSW